MRGLDQGLMQEIVSVLLSSGGQFADVYFQDMSARQVEAESGRVERISTVRERGVGLRIIKDLVTHFATTVDLTPSALLDLARNLASGAGKKGGPRVVRLESAPPGPLPAGEDPTRVPLDEKAKMVMEAIDTLNGFDGRLVQVKTVFRDSSVMVQVANSDGVLAVDTRGYGIFLVQVVASDGEHVQVGYEPVGGTGGYDVFRALDPGAVARTAARRALTMLEAPEAPSGRMSVGPKEARSLPRASSDRLSASGSFRRRLPRW
ncbi:MAG: hypothetical protein JSV00_00005 [bacterium]|nr:MAG: hypothetical protein JSV00_00005 [bacterium]